LPPKSASLVTSFQVATILAALAANPIASLAQQATGTIIGVVQDASGSQIPNAAVSLSHSATGTTRMVRTNDRGEFTSPFMRVGEYVVTAEAPGFKKRVVNGIVLQVDQTANLKLDLEVGQVNESVEVTAAAPLLETATSSLGQVIENRKILALPLNGRNTFALGLLAGNTIPITGMGTNLPFVAGGGRYASNDVLWTASTTTPASTQAQ